MRDLLLIFSGPAYILLFFITGLIYDKQRQAAVRAWHLALGIMFSVWLFNKMIYQHIF